MQKAFVLCRLFKKADVRTNEAPCDDVDVSSYAASDFEGQVPGHTIPEVRSLTYAEIISYFQYQLLHVNLGEAFLELMPSCL